MIEYVVAGMYGAFLAYVLFRRPDLLNGPRRVVATWRALRDDRARVALVGERAARMLDAGFPEDLAYLADPTGAAYPTRYRTAYRAQAARRGYARRKAARRRDAHLNRVMRGEVSPATRARVRSTRRTRGAS